jgi:hypothetical protein
VNSMRSSMFSCLPPELSMLDTIIFSTFSYLLSTDIYPQIYVSRIRFVRTIKTK